MEGTCIAVSDGEVSAVEDQMKDAKGHGSDTRGGLAAHQDATVSAVPTKAGIDAMVERLRTNAKPDLSRAAQIPSWLAWFGASQRRQRREARNG